MKNIVFKIFITLIVAVGLGGCYTIIWTPQDNFPTEDNSEYEDYGYYPPTYYGEYNHFYHHPWWYSVAPPAQKYVRDSDKPEQDLRNEINGRGNSGRNGILQTGLPSVGSSSPSTGSASTGTAKDNSGKRVETKGTTSSDSSRSSSSGNNSSNTVRNNNGNRNSDGRK